MDLLKLKNINQDESAILHSSISNKHYCLFYELKTRTINKGFAHALSDGSTVGILQISTSVLQDKQRSTFNFNFNKIFSIRVRLSCQTSLSLHAVVVLLSRSMN
jgi:hypothetical protein